MNFAFIRMGKVYGNIESLLMMVWTVNLIILVRWATELGFCSIKLLFGRLTSYPYRGIDYFNSPHIRTTERHLPRPAKLPFNFTRPFSPRILLMECTGCHSYRHTDVQVGTVEAEPEKGTAGCPKMLAWKADRKERRFSSILRYFFKFAVSSDTANRLTEEVVIPR